MSKRCLLIPDLQVAPGRTLSHLSWAARYIADKQPDIIIQIGDWADFPSLSSYDRGKASAENKRVSKDWDAFRTSVDLLMSGWSSGKYKPRMVYTKGNHEFRAERYQQDNPAVDVLPDTGAYLAGAGWETYEFLDVARVEGCLVSHYFPRTLTGRVTSGSQKYGAPRAEVMIRANMASCIAGHKPGFDYATFPGVNRILHGVIAGSFYQHNEEYMGPQGHSYWRGVVMLNRIKNGAFDICPVSMEYLRERYG